MSWQSDVSSHNLSPWIADQRRGDCKVSQGYPQVGKVLCHLHYNLKTWLRVMRCQEKLSFSFLFCFWAGVHMNVILLQLNIYSLCLWLPITFPICKYTLVSSESASRLIVVLTSPAPAPSSAGISDVHKVSLWGTYSKIWSAQLCCLGQCSIVWTFITWDWGWTRLFSGHWTHKHVGRNFLVQVTALDQILKLAK